MMTVSIKVKRTSDAGKSFHWQEYELDCPKEFSIADALRLICDKACIEGKPEDAPAWECSCSEGKCGACAMVINGKPMLACQAFISESGPQVILEPLSKFPVVEDLRVDRSGVIDTIKDMQLWLDADEGASVPERDWQLRFDANACLACGCCLEVCPNFKMSGSFVGAMGAAASFNKLTAKDQDKQQMRAARKEYRKHMYRDCSKSLSCKGICPAELPLDRLMSRNSAASLFGLLG